MTMSATSQNESRFLFAGALVGLGWLIFRYRVRAAAVRMSVRHAARLAERERIARQIHDTFLQGVQAFLLHLSVAKDRACQDRSVQPVLDHLFQLSENVADEIRTGIEQLRELPSQVTGLSEALSGVLQALVARQSTKVDVSTLGHVRTLASDASENIFAVAQEAIRNAVLHADAQLVQVQVKYSRFSLTVQVKDDGSGISRIF